MYRLMDRRLIFLPDRIGDNNICSQRNSDKQVEQQTTQTVLASPVKLPTIARSDALKSCSKIPVAATGNA